VLDTGLWARLGNGGQLAFKQAATGDALDFAIESLGVQKVTYTPMRIRDGQPDPAIPEIFAQLGQPPSPGEIHVGGAERSQTTVRILSLAVVSSCARLRAST
jgi:hypothetical protein